MKRTILLLLFSCFIITVKAQDINQIASVETDGSGSISLVRFDKGTKVAAAKASSVLLRMFQMHNDLAFKKITTETDELGFTHERYRVVYKNIEIDAGGIITHSRNGLIEYITSTVPNIKKGSDATSEITKESALKYALNAVGAKKYMWELKDADSFLKRMTNNPDASYKPVGNLYLINDPKSGEGNFVLAYKFMISAQEPEGDYLVLIDANNGSVIGKKDFNAHSNTPGTADTRYNGTKTIITDSYSSGYRLRETTRGQGVETYNMQKNTFLYIPQNFIDFSDNDNNWSSSEYDNANFDNAAFDAHWGAEMTYDYFLQKHNRNSYNGTGGKIFSYVHYDANLGNAYWSRRAHVMILGDGNATYNPFTAPEIMGHEFGHGLWQYTVVRGEEYPYSEGSEEGAIEEGFSDIWGICVEKFAATNPNADPWINGELVKKNSPNGERNFRNPSVNSYTIEGASSTYPDTYMGTGYHYDHYNPAWSHVNGNVVGFWFFLLSEGQNGVNDKGTSYCVSGIGTDKAAQIVYRAEAVLLPWKPDIQDLAPLAKQAAIDLFGANSNEYTQVVNALIAVNLEPKRTYSLSIAGPSSFCTSADYSIPNLPPLSTVSWSVAPWGLIPTPNVGQVNLSKTHHGTYTLTANIDICNGTSYTITKPNIVAGLLPPNYYIWTSVDQSLQLIPYPDGYNYVWENTWINFSSFGSSVPTQYTFEGGTISGWSASGNWVNFFMPPGGWANFSATQTVGGCTETIQYTFVGTYGPYSAYRMAPNPVKTDLTIYIEEKSMKNQKAKSLPDQSIKQNAKSLPDQSIKKVVIMDRLGRMVAQQNYPVNTKQATIDVRRLLPDMYIARIYDGKNWTVMKFLKN